MIRDRDPKASVGWSYYKCMKADATDPCNEPYVAAMKYLWPGLFRRANISKEERVADHMEALLGALYYNLFIDDADEKDRAVWATVRSNCFYNWMNSKLVWMALNVVITPLLRLRCLTERC